MSTLFNNKSQAFENSIRNGKCYDNNTLLQAYAYYKQATVGNNNTPYPSIFDLKGKAKWDTWNKLKGMSSTEAQQKYVDFVTKLGL